MKTKMRYTILQIAFLIFPIFLFGQQDSLSIQQKILESEESKQMLIQKTRYFIYNKLKSDNISEARDAYDYILDQCEKEDTQVFWYSEKFLLGFWFGRYEILYAADSISTEMETYRSVRPYSNRNYISPQPDELYMNLGKLSFEHRDKLIRRIDSLVLNRENQEYLLMFFDWLTYNQSKTDMSPQEERKYLENNLTPRAEEFLAIYKDSKFRPFVQKHFRYVYTLSDWGFGYYLGLGSLTPQGTVEQYLKPEISLGMGFSLSWKQIILDAGFDIGIPREIRKPFTQAGTEWITGVAYNYYPYSITAGLIAKESSSMKLSPHIGIGGISVDLCEGDQKKVNYELSMAKAALQIGTACELKISVGNDYYFSENSYSYSGIKFDIDYFHFLGNDPVLSGGMLRFRISWTSFNRSITRDL